MTWHEVASGYLLGEGGEEEGALDLVVVVGEPVEVLPPQAHVGGEDPEAALLHQLPQGVVAEAHDALDAPEQGDLLPPLGHRFRLFALCLSALRFAFALLGLLQLGPQL